MSWRAPPSDARSDACLPEQRPKGRPMKTNPNTKAASLRVAIYARFSSDLQNDRSCEDQMVLCRDYAKRHGWHVAATFHDAALSGATIHGRAGYQRLLHAASNHQFDVVLAEDLDR